MHRFICVQKSSVCDKTTEKLELFSFEEEIQQKEIIARSQMKIFAEKAYTLV